MGVVCGGQPFDGRGHSGAVGDCDVVDEDGRIFVGAPLEGGSSVANGDGIGDGERAVVAFVAVAEIESILSVVVEAGVIDVGGGAGAFRRSDSLSVTAVALAEAGSRNFFGILLIASVPLDGGVF